MQYSMVQWYVFKDLSLETQLRIQNELKELGKRHTMNGLILVAPEGCNGTVAGSPEAAQEMEGYITKEFGTLPFQHWTSTIKPFRRFKVDIRKEIVALKKPEIRPTTKSDHLPPKDFHTMLEREDVTVIDTRNWYETNIGSFKNAIIPNTKSFQEFPKFVQESNIPKDKPVAMYCTTGIRCEKAAEEMRQQGYQEVYQLDGGITNYLREFPDGAWQGECFVFDHRSAVDSHLEQSKRYALCASCGNPGDVRTDCKNCSTPCVMCELCLQRLPAACSKACKRAQEHVGAKKEH
jgi:UPF0176 protein